jgi:alpha-tubulin suppressor-like RCC1 family protein
MQHKVLAPKHGDELRPYLIGSPARDGDGEPTGYLSGERVVQAVASSIHSAVLTETGRVFTFGCGSDGR